MRFLGNLVLNLWDCGGQEKFMESYFESQRDLIFRNVEVLIYVFDVESKEKGKDLAFFQSCIEAIAANSKNAHIFCLVHKMDVLKSDQERARVFGEKQAELVSMAGALSLKIACFQTSIWDETLYKAWSQIVYALMPNVRELESHLVKFCEIIGADEVVVFEKGAFACLPVCIRFQPSSYSPVCFSPLTHFLRAFSFPAMYSHILGDFARHRQGAARHSPLRKNLQHHQAVQAKLRQDADAAAEHGGSQLQLYCVHRRVHLEHVCHGRHVRPAYQVGGDAHEYRVRTRSF